MMTATDVLGVLSRLEAAGLTAWVDGGWGVDALLGRQTREHEDLDLVVALADVERIRAGLAPLGFAMHEDQLPVRFVLRDGNGEQIDFHTVTFDEQG
ncbi:MAG TPA: amino acid transporter, partial [Actinomycetes bacterium]|nr:amino acid transporter [Actinomycetes bacterium]